MNCQKSKQGFTLIELLVVISIISLLSTIIFANITESRKRARDVVRLTDLRDMQIALELYFNDNGQYPFGNVAFSPWTSVSAPGSWSLDDPDPARVAAMRSLYWALVPKYLPKLPLDPVNKEDVSVVNFLGSGPPYSIPYDTGYVYYSELSLKPKSYTLGTNMESGTRPPSVFGNYQIKNP
jgi:prepilin-type N-terminal cleavage/methylation domain-containing protein